MAAKKKAKRAAKKFSKDRGFAEAGRFLRNPSAATTVRDTALPPPPPKRKRK
jgi:hypothetical protein